MLKQIIVEAVDDDYEEIRSPVATQQLQRTIPQIICHPYSAHTPTLQLKVS